MQLDRLEPPMTRAEFEHRIYLLREEIRKGRLHIPKSMAVSLVQLRSLPNGRVDFLSVNEFTRLQANTTFQFQSKWFKEQLEQQRKASKDSPQDDLAEE